MLVHTAHYTTFNVFWGLAMTPPDGAEIIANSIMVVTSVPKLQR